jgi:hypothetical protein
MTCSRVAVRPSGATSQHVIDERTSLNNDRDMSLRSRLHELSTSNASAQPSHCAPAVSQGRFARCPRRRTTKSFAS